MHGTESRFAREASVPVEAQRALIRRFAVANLAEQGYPAGEIARLLGVARERVQRDLRRRFHEETRARFVREWAASALLVARLQRRDANHRRRARERGNHVERVRLAEIVVRDEATCYLCGDVIVPGELHFDHVVPIARGGAHAAENLRATHARCNQSKGSR